MKRKVFWYAVASSAFTLGFLAWLFDGIDQALWWLDGIVGKSLIDQMITIGVEG